VQPEPNLPLPDDSDPDRYKLDTSKFPRRLDLELDPAALRHLQALAERSGRDLSEVASDLFSRIMRELPPEP
jgi:hypothetical protein